MAGMLYLHNEIKIAQELQTLLYEQHLRSAGMHAYPLFVGVQCALEVSVDELIKMLDHRMTQRALETLANIIRKYDGENVAENVKRMTWKYVRIFDSSYFLGIKTKNCAELVCILAYLSNLVGVQGNSVLGIVHITNLGESDKQYYKVVAQRIYYAILSSKIVKM